MRKIKERLNEISCTSYCLWVTNERCLKC